MRLQDQDCCMELDGRSIEDLKIDRQRTGCGLGMATDVKGSYSDFLRGQQSYGGEWEIASI